MTPVLLGAGRSRRAVLAAIGLVALIIGPIATAQLTRTAVRSPALLLADVAVGWSMIAAGLLIADRRRGNLIGPLAILTGSAWFGGDFASSGSAVIGYLASVAHGWFDPLFALVILAYPGGRITRRPERILAVGFLAVQAAWTVVLAYTLRPIAWWPCPDCLGTVDAWIDAQIAMEWLGRVETAALTTLSLGVLVLVAIRWVQASGAARRRLAPVVAAGAVLALGFTGGFLLQTVAPASARTGEGELRVIALAILRIGVAVGLLVGVLRDRADRERIADLVIGLDALPTTAALQGSLRDALADPSATVYRWDPALGGYRNAAGLPADRPEDDARRAVVTIGEGDGPGLAIALDPVLRDDPGLVAAAVAAVRLAVENERLQAEVRAQLEDVRTSRARIVEAQDVERRRIERDLHDGAQQRLVSLQLSLQLLRRALPADADPATVADLDAAADDAREAVREIRELAHGVHPAILSQSGLGPALVSLAERAPITVKVDVDGIDGRLPPPVEATAYFVAAESITNAAKHARAGQVSLMARRDGALLRLEVIDDGHGGATLEGGTGLRGLEDRVAALRGTFQLSSPVDGGTRIVVELPCASS